MADFDDKNDEFIVFDVAENAVVTDAIAPLASEVVLEGFAKSAGILRWCNAVLEEAPDAFGCRFIQLGKVSLGAFAELNRPNRRDRGS